MKLLIILTTCFAITSVIAKVEIVVKDGDTDDKKLLCGQKGIQIKGIQMFPVYGKKDQVIPPKTLTDHHINKVQVGPPNKKVDDILWEVPFGTTVWLRLWWKVRWEWHKFSLYILTFLSIRR